MDVLLSHSEGDDQLRRQTDEIWGIIFRLVAIKLVVSTLVQALFNQIIRQHLELAAVIVDVVR